MDDVAGGEVIVDVPHGGALWMNLKRSQRLNPLADAAIHTMRRALDDLDSNAAHRVLVLSAR